MSSAKRGKAVGPVADGTATGYATGKMPVRHSGAAPKAAGGTPPVLDATKAHAELASNSMAQIERATSLAWGGRALASYELSAAQTNPMEAINRFGDGDAFRQEALEHGAMADDKNLVSKVGSELDDARAGAIVALQRVIMSPRIAPDWASNQAG